MRIGHGSWSTQLVQADSEWQIRKDSGWPLKEFWINPVTTIKGQRLRGRFTRLKNPASSSLAVGSWACCLTSLNLRFLICEMKIKVESTSSGYHEDEVNQLIYVPAVNGAWHIVSATFVVIFSEVCIYPKRWCNRIRLQAILLFIYSPICLAALTECLL